MTGVHRRPPHRTAPSRGTHGDTAAGSRRSMRAAQSRRRGRGGRRVGGGNHCSRFEAGSEDEVQKIEEGCYQGCDDEEEEAGTAGNGEDEVSRHTCKEQGREGVRQGCEGVRQGCEGDRKGSKGEGFTLFEIEILLTKTIQSVSLNVVESFGATVHIAHA